MNFFGHPALPKFFSQPESNTDLFFDNDLRRSSLLEFFLQFLGYNTQQCSEWVGSPHLYRKTLELRL